MRRRSIRGPALLALVFGAFLAIVGLTAAGQALIVTADSSSAFLDDTIGADAATVRAFVNLYLSPSDVAGPDLPGDRRSLLDGQLAALTQNSQILQAAIATPKGVVLAASQEELVGRDIGSDPSLQGAARGGAAQAAILDRASAGALAPDVPSILREAFPVLSGGRVYAVVSVWRDAGPVLTRLDEARLHVVVVILTGALITAALLFVIFRRAQALLTRQQRELLESTRRDALTAALNHGAIVEELAERLATLEPDDGSLAVALLDIDSLGLLNATYGHAAGDEAITSLAGLLPSVLDEAAVWGRYGPDEFLVVAPARSATELQATMADLRARSAELALTFGASERLPLTFSCGICSAPANGESVTGLLSVAAQALEEARASGGDATRVAEAGPSTTSTARTFDVLQGLVIAVDTKDRYTRRHSEEVARYADFLAGRLDLDREVRAAVHTAGLLHDIGKIGIPDVILRKPGRLSEDEYAIVKQHVALGDMIVRDLPRIDLIRAGVRHHHERWDGRGYLDRLEGEQIPLIARILAVADAFSAMTSTRPYRKALSVDEALRRLEDAAGSQLHEDLVVAFVTGIRSADHPPLPGEMVEARFWTPYRRVA